MNAIFGKIGKLASEEVIMELVKMYTSPVLLYGLERYSLPIADVKSLDFTIIRFLIQETQLSLTNRATHLCKCNDVADLTSVIKIRLKKIDSSHPALQGHSRSLETTRIDPLSMIFY